MSNKTRSGDTVDRGLAVLVRALLSMAFVVAGAAHAEENCRSIVQRQNDGSYL